MEAERLYTKQPSRTIQQKRGGEGALEMVDNRPAGILQAMSEHPIQRVKTDLRVQNGPSCWLTVLESIASYFPQVLCMLQVQKCEKLWMKIQTKDT